MSIVIACALCLWGLRRVDGRGVLLFDIEDLHFGEEGSCDADLLLGYGMDKLQVAGQQRDATSGVATTGTVFEIPLDRMAEVGELGANLVLASGEEVDAKQRVAITLRHHLILQLAALCTLGSGVDDKTLIHASVREEIIIDASRLLGESTLHHSEIRLMQLTTTQHIIEAGEGLGSLGESHHTPHRAVDAMHYAAEYIARFVVLLLKIHLNLLGEGSVAGLIPLHYLPLCLIYYDNMIVFV